MDLGTAYKVYLGLGASLGFVSTFLAIRKEITKGPKVTATVTDAKFIQNSTRITSMVGNKEVLEISAVFHAHVQFQNSGTDLTSIVRTGLNMNGQLHGASVTRIDRLQTMSGETKFAFTVREKDKRTIAIPPGAAIVESFQFEVTSNAEFNDPHSGGIHFEFVNHKPLMLEASFEKRSN